MKIYLWPEGTAAEPLLAEIDKTPGLERGPAPLDSQAAAFVYGGLSRLRGDTLRDACESYRGELLVSVVEHPILRWHVFEPAACLFLKDLILEGPDLRIPVPVAAREGALYAGFAILEGGRVVFNQRVEVPRPAIARPERAVLYVGHPHPEPNDWVLAQFDGRPLRKGTHIRMDLSQAIDSIASEDYMLPISIPNYVDYDAGAGGLWRNAQRAGTVIQGRQDAPSFLRAVPAVMIGTREEVQHWDTVVGEGRARGFRLPAEEAEGLPNHLLSPLNGTSPFRGPRFP